MRVFFRRSAFQDVVVKAFDGRRTPPRWCATVAMLAAERLWPAQKAARRGMEGVALLRPAAGDASYAEAARLSLIGHAEVEEPTWPKTRRWPSSRSAGLICRPVDQRATLIGLGLNRIRRRSTLQDTPAVRGMIAKVASSRPHRRRALSHRRTSPMKLNEINDNPGARKSRISRRPRYRLGQGQDGRPRRQGPEVAHGRRHQGRFEGGQMPLHRRLPKRGFTNIFALDFNEVGLGRIQVAIDAPADSDAAQGGHGRGAEGGGRHPSHHGTGAHSRQWRRSRLADLRGCRRVQAGARGDREGRAASLTVVAKGGAKPAAEAEASATWCANRTPRRNAA